MRPDSACAQASSPGSGCDIMSYKMLKKVVDALDLSDLDRFQRKRRRKVGRKGNKISSYVKAWMIKHILRLPSEAQLARKLKNEDRLRMICKFKRAPCKSSYCKARKRFSLKGVDFLFNFLVQKAKKLGLAKGGLVAIDSTDFEAHCKGNKKLRYRSDKCARWGHSTIRGRVFGYKAHIICDAETELPLAVKVFPANVNDALAFFSVFRNLLKNFRVGIQKLLADAGYDSSGIRKILRDIKAVIARNGRGRHKSVNPKDKDYGKRWSVERINSRAKEELGLDNLKMKGLWAATFHSTAVLCSMLYAAIGSFLCGFKNYRSIVNLR